MIGTIIINRRCTGAQIITGTGAKRKNNIAPKIVVFDVRRAGMAPFWLAREKMNPQMKSIPQISKLMSIVHICFYSYFMRLSWKTPTLPPPNGPVVEGSGIT